MFTAPRASKVSQRLCGAALARTGFVRTAPVWRGDRMDFMAQDNTSRFVWFVAGVAIGSTIALLYAPHSGEKTRRMIGRKAREGREQLTDSGRELVDKGRELYEKGRKVADSAAEMIERGRRMVEG